MPAGLVRCKLHSLLVSLSSWIVLTRSVGSPPSFPVSLSGRTSVHSDPIIEARNARKHLRAQTSMYEGIANSSIHKAQQLRAPRAETTQDGELEGANFWEEHGPLLRLAWQELDPRNAVLYTMDSAFERRYITEEVRRAVALLRAGALGKQMGRESEQGHEDRQAAEDSRPGGQPDSPAERTRAEESIWRLFEEVIPGVWLSDKVFTREFCDALMSELDHIEASGIPKRRPNGMNRFGSILSDVEGGVTTLSPMIDELTDKYVRPLAEMLFSDVIGSEDAVERYAFTVRYRLGEDLGLAEHRDASVATMNLCLGKDGFGGGGLYFVDPVTKVQRDLTFPPGTVVFHKGEVRHSARELVSGERTNFIVWLYGRHGVVRFAPYPPKQRTTWRQRWGPRGTGDESEAPPAPAGHDFFEL
mmetsp:Transcript_9785/g.35843  ORF Transcript_9785/g.35843 Transcript_9785/m.35843 type:complete len:416 (+) Transcript_9785:72-1319(+)